MSQIRILVRDVWYTLQTTDLGVIRVAARIVAALARDSARMVPGVRVALGRSTHSKLAELAEQASLRHRHHRCRRRRPRPHRRRRPRRSGHLRRSRPRRGTRHPAACHRHPAGEYRPANHHRERHRRRHPHRRRSVGPRPRQPDRIAVHRTRAGFLPRGRDRATAITSRVSHPRCRTTTTLGGRSGGACPAPKARRPAMNSSGSPPRSGWCARMNCRRRRSVSLTQHSPASPPLPASSPSEGYRRVVASRPIVTVLTTARNTAAAAESIPDGAAPDLFLQRREVLLAGVIRASWR